jgi:peptidoglycan hydrolase-like protein with peptidoglycan-binding domain
VRAAQELLQAYGVAGDAVDIVVDGVYGKKTQKAVRVFQKESDIRIDGVISLQT